MNNVLHIAKYVLRCVFPCIELTSRCFSCNNLNISHMPLQKWCNTSSINCTILQRTNYKVVCHSCRSIDNHYTSVRISNSETVGETEYTSSWWRIPRDRIKGWAEVKVVNMANTFSMKLLMLYTCT